MARDFFENQDPITGGAPGTPFWRDDATTVVIYVSDEPDQSIGGWSAYTNFFDNLRPSIDQMKHFGVIGDAPSGCSWSYNGMIRPIVYGQGYWDMIQRYSGEWYSICSVDWGAQMQDLANNVTIRTRFAIARTTLPGLINTWFH